MNDYEEYLNLVNSLKSLLDDPQPGLFTWHECLNKKSEALLEFLNVKFGDSCCE